MEELNSDQALTLVRVALAEAQARNFRPMGVVVVDAAGQVVASARQAGATELRLDIALGKAAASVGMGADSRALVQRAADMPVFYGSIAAVARQKFVPQTGAVLLKTRDGRILGAIGASGGTGDEDEQICAAAAAAAELR